MFITVPVSVCNVFSVFKRIIPLCINYKYLSQVQVFQICTQYSVNVLSTATFLDDHVHGIMATLSNVLCSLAQS